MKKLLHTPFKWCIVWPVMRKNKHSKSFPKLTFLIFVPLK